MSEDIQPKFFTFMQCTFGNSEWDSISKLSNEKQWIMERMSRFRSRLDGARVNILDMSYREIKMKFKKDAIVGVGDGMFYCDSTDATETKITDSPPEYIYPKPISDWE